MSFSETSGLHIMSYIAINSTVLPTPPAQWKWSQLSRGSSLTNSIKASMHSGSGQAWSVAVILKYCSPSFFTASSSVSACTVSMVLFSSAFFSPSRVQISVCFPTVSCRRSFSSARTSSRVIPRLLQSFFPYQLTAVPLRKPCDSCRRSTI